MGNLKVQFAKLIALFYNWLRPQDRVMVYSGTSTLLTGVLALITAKVTNFQTDNQLILLLLAFGLLLIVAFINNLQSKLKDLGDKELAKDGNTKVLEVAQKKVSEASKLVETVKKNT